MKLIFFSSRTPDYEKDCLMQLGHLHGKAVAKRLKDKPIDSIYSSLAARQRFSGY